MVIAGDVDYSESGVFISELNSCIGCDLRAAVQPEEGGGGAGAGQPDAAVELRQICGVSSQHHTGDFSYKKRK